MEVSYISLCFFFLVLVYSVNGRPLQQVQLKPDPTDAAATARWLVSQNSWGVLSTISSELGGAPFGNVVSFSDGLPDKGYGIPYFYLTTLDPTARNALKDERSSFTISEFPIGSCGKKDPENPTCAKLTLTGKLKVVKKNTKEAEFAESFLFSKHAEMKDWPKNHDFQIFKIDIEDIFLIDWFGGPKPLSLAQYLQPKILHHGDKVHIASLYLESRYLVKGLRGRNPVFLRGGKVHIASLYLEPRYLVKGLRGRGPVFLRVEEKYKVRDKHI